MVVEGLCDLRGLKVKDGHAIPLNGSDVRERSLWYDLLAVVCEAPLLRKQLDMAGVLGDSHHLGHNVILVDAVAAYEQLVALEFICDVGAVDCFHKDGGVDHDVDVLRRGLQSGLEYLVVKDDLIDGDPG